MIINWTERRRTQAVLVAGPVAFPSASNDVEQAQDFVFVGNVPITYSCAATFYRGSAFVGNVPVVFTVEASFRAESFPPPPPPPPDPSLVPAQFGDVLVFTA